jgi:hypothetical protein
MAALAGSLRTSIVSWPRSPMSSTGMTTLDLERRLDAGVHDRHGARLSRRGPTTEEARHLLQRPLRGR